MTRQAMRAYRNAFARLEAEHKIGWFVVEAPCHASCHPDGYTIRVRYTDPQPVPHGVEESIHTVERARQVVRTLRAQPEGWDLWGMGEMPRDLSASPG